VRAIVEIQLIIVIFTIILMPLQIHQEYIWQMIMIIGQFQIIECIKLLQELLQPVIFILVFGLKVVLAVLLPKEMVALTMRH